MYGIYQLEEALIKNFRKREFKVRLDSIANYLAYSVENNTKIKNNDFIMELMKEEGLFTISENDENKLSITRKGRILYEKFKETGYYRNKEKVRIKVL